MAISEFLIGGATGIAGEMIRDGIKDKIKETIPSPKDEWELFIQGFPNQWQKLLKNVEDMANSSSRTTLRTTQTLQAYPYEYSISNYGRPHISIFCLSSYQVRFFVAGIGIYIATLQAGWNAIDIPDQSTVSLPMGTSGQQVVLIQASDTSLGNAI